LLVEPFTQQARRRWLLVLDDQRFQPRRRHQTGLGMSLVSSSFATFLTAAAKRSTISASSASVLVNGGANRVWSPANPSRVGIVEYVIKPCSKATSSTLPAVLSSGARNDLPSRGSTYST